MYLILRWMYAGILLVGLLACRSHQIPSVRYTQYDYGKSFTWQNDTLSIYLMNPLACPLRIWVNTTNTELLKVLGQQLPIVLPSGHDTTLIFPEISSERKNITFTSRLGDTTQQIREIEIDFPFPNNRTYTVLQGNNTNFTHNTDWSRFAIDFNMKTGDTICSATDGYVVGLIDKYFHSGKEPRWKPYANFITIYDSASGLYCQYVHVAHRGSLVKIGDEVKRGQPIAFSGNTGQSTEEHLHFNCLIPEHSEEGLRSVPFTFIGGIRGTSLKKGDEVGHGLR